VDKPDRHKPVNGRGDEAPARDPLLVNLGLTSQIGLTMVASILVGLYVGHRLDQWSGGGHLWMVVGVLLGVASGFWGVYKIIDRVLTCDEDKK
jgi:F0F1-type ATP synthase assembly protein I